MTTKVYKTPDFLDYENVNNVPRLTHIAEACSPALWAGWGCSNAPSHDVSQFLLGEEAGVLPDLPQGALELLLVLVLQAFLLALLLGVATLLTIVQPAVCARGRHGDYSQWLITFSNDLLCLDLFYTYSNIHSFRNVLFLNCKSNCRLTIMSDLHLNNFGRKKFEGNGLFLLKHKWKLLCRCLR